jgi:hypothetical protein
MKCILLYVLLAFCHIMCRLLCCTRYAGTDTAGGTLAFVLYELGRHQDVQQKLRQEISTVMEGAND